jgi:hypothetical protein
MGGFLGGSLINLEREIKELAMPRARAYKTQIIYNPQMDLIDGFSIMKL